VLSFDDHPLLLQHSNKRLSDPIGTAPCRILVAVDSFQAQFVVVDAGVAAENDASILHQTPI